MFATIFSKFVLSLKSFVAKLFQASCPYVYVYLLIIYIYIYTCTIWMGSTCFTSTHVDARHANPLELRRWLLPDIVIIHLCATLHIVHGRLTVILTSLQHTNMEHLPSLNCHVGALFSCIVWWNTWHWLSFAWQQMSVIDVGWVQQLHPYKKIPCRICSKSGCVCSPVPQKTFNVGMFCHRCHHWHHGHHWHHWHPNSACLNTSTAANNTTAYGGAFGPGNIPHCLVFVWVTVPKSWFVYKTYLSRPPPKGTPRNNILIILILIYFTIPRTFQFKKKNILRRGVVVGRISHEDFKKNVENSKRHWHLQSETHKKMIQKKKTTLQKK